jgi:antiviral helicase SLH1
MAAVTAPSALSQEEWRTQVEAMKRAVAGLRPAAKAPNGAGWQYDEEDDDDNDYSVSSASSSHDVWDFISDSELDDIEFDSGDLADGVSGVDGTPYNTEWFATRCSQIASTKSGLDAHALQTQVMEILSSSRLEDELQSALTDLVGFDDLDFVIELLSHRTEIVAASTAETFQAQQAGGRLLTRSERDEALRRKDLEHKSAPLAAARAKEEEYPHVYRAFAAGNTLSHSGKRYALPVGSQRKEFEKYEEYSIPAGRTGTLWPGHKLISIADLDGLCRSTFKGYKTLNRMQSLVYPVAYKTSENMLICAPTGAVSHDHIVFRPICRVG